MLKGRSVLLTGASSGIGLALALALAKEEAVLHLGGRDEKALGEVARQARSWGATATIYPLELTDDAALTRASTRGRSIVRPGSGHWVHFDDPDLVVNAIHDVVMEVRG